MLSDQGTQKEALMKPMHNVILLSGLVLVALSGVAWAGVPVITVPEPTSLAVLAAGIGGLAWVKFRRRK